MQFRAPLVPLAALTGIWAAWGQAADPSQTERIVFISGQVLMEDGSPPPDAVLIQRICSGRSVFAARTDAKGRFSFSVDGGSGRTAGADASQPPPPAPGTGKALNASSSQYTNPITSALRDCELEAVLPGFQAARVNLALRSTSDDGRVGSIILHPLARTGALTVSVTTAAAPQSARKAYEKGLEAFNKRKWAAAASEFTKAVALYPGFAEAWYRLGQARQNGNDFAGAIQAWTEARKQDPRYLQPYESLAVLADAQHDWTASEKYSREWIELDPDGFPAAYLINAIANARLNRLVLAERAAREGLRLDRDHKFPRLNYVLGLILMQTRQYAESARCFRTYLELAPGARDAAAVRQQIEKLESRR